jgi:hypothetical protein
MFDIFYSGVKPNLFAHEQRADSIEHAQQLSRTRYFWWVNYLTDYTGFDFLWEPVPWESHQRHAWPSQWQKDSGTYLVPRQGAEETNYRTEHRLTRLPSRDVWTVPSNFDYDTFDFSWHPDPTDPPYTYQFGTQHQRTGGPQYYNGGTDLKFVDQIRGSLRVGATPIVEIDHMDGNAGQVANVVKTVRYFDNYKDVLTRIANTVESEYVWIVSSNCDYTNFDFSWHPEFWQSTMLHVFASDGEKFGDTFYMHVPSFKKRIGQFELLDWYDVNFIDSGVKRRPLPVVQHNYDTHVDAVTTIDFKGPLAIYTTKKLEDNIQVPPIPLWREKVKTITPLNEGASVCIVPKVSVPYIKTQLYDYPYIDRTKKNSLDSEKQDIIFISYDEPEADKNWQILSDKFPRAKRLHGVKGMENALAAAAELSSTPWYFAVFAKTIIHETFDFSFVPDYMQQAKHYIFYSENRVNKLVYGEMAVIMYNCNLILDARGKEFGLDYTLSFPHEVIPIVSSYGNFDTSPYHAWRTAFRETAKLAYFESQQTTVEGAYRLKTWLEVAEGDYADWVLKGSGDGLEFFKQSTGDLAFLKQSFRWEWLREYFVNKYGDVS